jgi:hypothetical protein
MIGRKRVTLLPQGKPSKKEGKSAGYPSWHSPAPRLNESPFQRGKEIGCPALRRGHLDCLNESPSEKEGKSAFTFAVPVAACQPQ